MKKILTLLMSLAILLSLTGCGGSKNESTKSGQTEITFFVGIDTDTGNYYQELVDTYNNGQGKIDGVFVNYKPKAKGYDSDLSTVFAGTSVPDVLTISDQYFKSYTKQGYLYNIDTLIKESGLDLSKFSKNCVNRFRINWDTKTAGNESDPLYGVPNGTNPTFLYYNVDAFKAVDINIISISEEDLASYNKTNNTNYMPHGYAEYKEAPADGLVASKNLNGKIVYKVFNNKIPMSWNEVDTMSKYLTQSYNSNSRTKYGLLTEWWFGYGWTVGGDCMNWDDESNQYVFTLGNTYKNYLAVSNTSINGNDYSAGEIVSYADKKYLNDNPSAVNEALYELPSQYDAFAEFCSLSQVKDKAVDYNGKKGLAISPSPATLGSYSNEHFFTAENIAMVQAAIVSMNMIKKSTEGRFEWDIAPIYQYREYENGELDSNGNLKVIGEDGYTGELKKVNGTAIVGYQSGSDLNDCYAIPAKASNPESAAKFIAWAAGEEGQAVLAKSNALIPNSISYGLSNAYINSSDRICDNIYIAVKAAEYEDIGDWSYVEDGQWVNYWATILNSDVRNGDMALDKFFANKEVTEYANINLAKYEIHLAGK